MNTSTTSHSRKTLSGQLGFCLSLCLQNILFIFNFFNSRDVSLLACLHCGLAFPFVVARLDWTKSTVFQIKQKRLYVDDHQVLSHSLGTYMMSYLPTL